DMDGFEVAQILKSNKRTKDIPIVFASAEKKEHKSMIKGFEGGAIDYLFKPLDPELTRAKIAVLLQVYLQKKELIEKNSTLGKYALLINNSTDLICIVDPETLKFEEVNQASMALLGYTPEEMKGTSLLYYLAEEDRSRIQKICRTKESSLTFEAQIHSKTRAIKWLQWRVVNKDGLWFANAVDITDIKEVEEIKNYLSTVVKQSEDAIYLHNPDGRIVSWNEGAEKIYGFAETEALDMNIWNIVPQHLMSESQAIITKILKGEKVLSFETKRITKYGKIVDIVFSASVITDLNGALKSVAITERDITHQKISEQEINELNADLKKNVSELEAANKELEAFSYSVSHDLRAPLRHIGGFAQLFSERESGRIDATSESYINIITDSVNRMGRLIDELLAFSRVIRREIRSGRVDLTAIVKETLTVLHPVTEDRNIKWNIGPLPEIEGDATLIDLVFTNLLSNAIKFTRNREEARIEIGALDGPEEKVTVFVRDNGAGFEMKYVDKLFGVFQRLHPEEEFEGTGIGLATVQRIVDRHGGRIWAESECDKGTTFYLTFRKAPDENAEHEKDLFR
ncbi:MAG TPA: PAS domain S-box protein, partial [Pyrinomonadaceae bacterium]|nr:PAS domain S-box protein [Pyrinomonadaceae bacterium]